MPTYIYKAVDKKGQIVKNKVEEASKQDLARMLKRNKLIPITITEIKYKKRTAKPKRNADNLEEVLKKVNTNNLTYSRKLSRNEKIKAILNTGAKITQRDLVIFTQNLFLLKKAGFNNIHALSTILDTTENLQLRSIVEDILLGIEAGRKYVYNNGILFRCVSIYIC